MADRRPPSLARRAPEIPRPAPVADEHCPGHTHRLPRAVLLTLVIICGGLVASLVLVSTLARQAQHQAAMTNQRLDALEDFIADRGAVRDRQNESLGDRITAAVCDLLDQLPAGPVLDPVRGKYGCGPGLPVESLSPEARQQLQRYRAAPTEQLPAVKPSQPTPDETDASPPTPTVAPPPVAPVQPTKPTTAGVAPAAPAPAPTTPPLVDLNPITDPVCTALGICA